MAETAIDVRHLPKAEAYETIEQQLRLTLEGIADPIATMATLSCLLHQGFGHLWAGFYRVVEPGRLLRVGPYQGTLGCLEIEFDRGVCGTAASTGRTVIVPDVNAFPGHIACDARSRSEIVVPVFDDKGTLIAVLDVDSERLGAFDHNDAAGLERLVRVFADSSRGVSSAATRE
jgi:L-methionine (R)-S-oxide reductase